MTEICEKKRKHITQKKQSVPIEDLYKKLKTQEPARGFHAALAAMIDQKKNALIAEIKKASPSKGIIRTNFKPEAIAKSYEKGGACCLSILTDISYFHGKDSYLSDVREHTTLPILRKDFILDPYQVVESRVLGADCILLIMAAIGDAQAHDIEKKALELGMDVLIEVHNNAELERALSLQSNLLGINNRNLKNMKTHLETTEYLCKMVPPCYTIISESGINSHEDIKRMNRSGVYGFLVGESLMRQNDIQQATRNLLAQ